MMKPHRSKPTRQTLHNRRRNHDKRSLTHLCQILVTTNSALSQLTSDDQQARLGRLVEGLAEYLGAQSRDQSARRASATAAN